MELTKHEKKLLKKKEREEKRRQQQEQVRKERTKKKTKKYLTWLIVLIVIISIPSWLLYNNPKKPGKYDDFALCLEEVGAKFYGAFWCSNCGEQKRLFGKSQRLLPYIECDERGADAKPQLCKEMGINAYPTWIFNDTNRLQGVQSLSTLARLTNCQLP